MEPTPTPQPTKLDLALVTVETALKYQFGLGRLGEPLNEHLHTVLDAARRELVMTSGYASAIDTLRVFTNRMTTVHQHLSARLANATPEVQVALREILALINGKPAVETTTAPAPEAAPEPDAV